VEHDAFRTPRGLGLAEAVARVATAGERLVVQRAELFRQEAQADLQRLAIAIALAVGAAVVLTGAVLLLALATSLEPWIPLSVTFLGFAVLLGLIAVGLATRANKLWPRANKLWARAKSPELPELAADAIDPRPAESSSRPAEAGALREAGA
jgi:hypothetical protein